MTYEDKVTVTSVTPTVGNVAERTTLTIAGTGFSATASSNVVRIGGNSSLVGACVVTSATSTQIVCNLDGGPPAAAAEEVRLASPEMVWPL